MRAIVLTRSLDELQAAWIVVPSEVYYQPKFTTSGRSGVEYFLDPLRRRMSRETAVREIARCFLANAGQTLRGELARVTGLSRQEAGRGNRAPVAKGYASMPILPVRDIDTPWAPYGLMFSRDGTRLAIGGGSWYGNGGIVLIDLHESRVEALQWKNVPWVSTSDIGDLTAMPSGSPAVSSVCFSDDDRYLAASAWVSRQHYAPTMLFGVDGTALRPCAAFDQRLSVPRQTVKRSSGGALLLASSYTTGT